MIAENIRLFFQLFYRPISAMSQLMDRGNWFFGGGLATVIAVLFALTISNRIYDNYEAVTRSKAEMRELLAQQYPSTTNKDEVEEVAEHFAPHLKHVQRPLPILGSQAWNVLSFRPVSYYAIIASLGILFAPALLMIIALLERTGTISVILRRDYGAMLSCVFFGWAASHLPSAVLGFGLQPTPAHDILALGLWAAATLFFAFLMVCALRTVCGASVIHSIVAVIGASLVFRFDSWMFSLATFSPFLTIIWIVPLVLGGAAAMRAAHLQRQSFRRQLEACAINDHDAEAQYQLGLIYQQRKQTAEALKHFKRSVEIDPNEPDANFQLGIFARLDGNLQEALNHFGKVLAFDEKYKLSEIWREIGATYLAAGMLEEAESALKKYYERRQYDPEGLYHYAELLSKKGETERAKEIYRQCIEAVKTMPYYRRNLFSKWGSLAQSKLSK